MGIKVTLIVLFVIGLIGCEKNPGQSPCINMEGTYQRIDSTHAIKENRDFTVYIKHINGTTNGFYGILDAPDIKESLQPLVKENPQCKIIFETVTLFYTHNSAQYGCHFALSENTDHSRYYCLRKTSDSIPVNINDSFDKVKNEPYFNDISEMGSAIEWNESL